ncbi:nose resistant to fluoxetine protein 6-like [Lutzomyia longipalpis]|uniref:nose resistant to fluoxetine protein 6-like n=1 Tax=Lutzomyia longipalpis TaxID=7200 RepID=UPI0024845DDB|nr:nose resistant to fluoxetine protein 6-like [Lutzomyia longipalpis]XP_055680188.1 nose resistant to fluoxetine protein 6-like [Lutzomyia longipalpis]XP_055680189.1 nose resistant to fluoxetine protein 6-like [Lutzomyia longipalpis]
MHSIDLWWWISIGIVGTWGGNVEGINGNCTKCQELHGIDSHPLKDHSQSHRELSTEHLSWISPLYGIIDVSRELRVNNKCYTELDTIGNALKQRQLWALKVLDGSASFTSGFTIGNSHWLGSRGACEAAKDILGVTFDERYTRSMDPQLFTTQSPFSVDYRVVYATHTSPLQFEMKFLAEKILHIGLCVPTSCTNADIWNITQLYLDGGIFQYHDIFHIDSVKVVQVKSLTLANGFHEKTSVRILCALVLFTTLMTLLSWRGDRVGKIDQKNNNGHVVDQNEQLEVEGKASGNGAVVDNGSNSIIEKTEIALHQKIVNCFSLEGNVRQLVSTKAPTDAISVINGIRSIVCFWILSFHMYWFQHFTVSNTATLFATGERPYFLLISNAPLLVDVFFTISGFLHTYNFLGNRTKLEEVKRNNFVQNAKLFGRMVLNRYIRLSPLYFVVCLFGEMITAYLMDVSQFWIHERYDLTCQRYWWRNVLYIHNLFDKDELCMNWGWSIACEMQYFIIFSLMLFIYAKNPQLSKKIFIAFTSGIIIISLVSHWRHRFQCSFDVIYNTGTELYMAPWNRIHPYISGILAGWYLISRDGKLNISQKTVRTLNGLSIFFFLLSMHSTIVRSVAYPWASVLITMGRFAFGLTITWLILCSKCGFGGWFTDFLSARPFVHINKLSYGVYLLNPLIITTIHGLRDGSSHFSPVISWVMTVGMMIIVYCVAFVFTLFFEIPYHNLGALLLRPSQRTERKIKCK